MAEAQPDEENMQTFDYEEAKGIIDTAAQSVMSDQAYQPKQVHKWTSMVVEQVLKSLQQASKPFKYVVTCVIMQKNGAGLHTASTCFWDTKTDGSCSVRWENDTMHAIITVYALHI